MENLTYVTGNHGKYISIKEKFENAGIKIGFFKCDLEEPKVNDIDFISKEKAREAYEILQSPVFVVDSGFYIEGFPGNPGYPGAFVKRSGVAENVDGLLKVMESVDNRNCEFVDCLTFYDGHDYYTFTGTNKGTLSKDKRGNHMQKAKSNLWFVFIPKNYDKTLAEMDDDERAHRHDDRVSATELFISWYKDVYLRQLKQVLEQ